MRMLYLDCAMGAAGDMLSGALLELMPDPDAFVERLNALGIPHVRFEAGREARGGLSGTRMRVRVRGHEEGEEHRGREDADGQGQEKDLPPELVAMLRALPLPKEAQEDILELGSALVRAAGGGSSQKDPAEGQRHHGHSTLADIREIVRSLPLPEKVRRDVLDVYGLIAGAEGRAHGVPVEQVHFHEVGALDAVADVAAVSLMLSELAPDQIVCSPVHVGSGTVRCAHGVLPVPAPATAYILEGVPVYGGSVQGELCTPTGAALLKHFATSFSSMPRMAMAGIGYGLGSRDFAEAPNCVRAILGEADSPPEQVCELACNVDDMTGEAIGFALERLIELGALDAYTVPIGMKKSRPGVLICVLCRERDEQDMTRAIFAHTTTIGIRRRSFDRCTLARSVRELETPWGAVRLKESEGFGTRRAKLEHDDLARIARERGISLLEAEALVDGWRS